MNLLLLPETFTICRLPAEPLPPEWALGGSFSTISYSLDELSIVCPQGQVPAELPGATISAGWRCLRVAGTMDLSLVGVMARLSGALAAAEISIFTVATYDTDYLLVRAELLPQAIAALAAAGFPTEIG
jgi:uncharacterized protein